MACAAGQGVPRERSSAVGAGGCATYALACSPQAPVSSALPWLMPAPPRALLQGVAKLFNYFAGNNSESEPAILASCMPGHAIA